MTDQHRSRGLLPLLAWLFFTILIWLPADVLLLSGLHLAHSAVIESASALLQRNLETHLLEFRRILDPSVLLTRLLNDGLAKADRAQSPQQWHQRVMHEFAALPTAGVDLLMTNSSETYPLFPTYDPSTFSAFLASITTRAECLSSIDRSITYHRQFQKDFDFFGNTRFSRWQWIYLPWSPGIGNRTFDDTWHEHKVTYVQYTPRNSWAAFGRANQSLKNWKYLLLFHRQHLPVETLRSLSFLLAKKLNLPVELQTSADAPASHTPSSQMLRNGGKIQVSEIDERYGLIIAHGDLPWRIWLLLVLGHVANACFSLAVLILVRRFFLGIPLNQLQVGGKLGLGLLVATAFPLFLALIGSEGASGAHLFRELQGQHVRMEQSLQHLEEEFDRHLEAMGTDHRKWVKRLRYPFIGQEASRTVDLMALENQISSIDLISSQSIKLLSRGPYSWATYRVALLPKPIRETFFREWCQRGNFFFPEELDMMALDASAPADLSAQRLTKMVLSRGRKGVKRVSFKLFEVVARILCESFNRGTVPDMDVEKAESGVLLNLVFKDRENQFFHEAFTSLGKMKNFRLAGYQGYSFFDVVLDDSGKAQILVLVFHRLSDLCEDFLFKALPQRTKQSDIDLMAIFLPKTKANLGHGLGQPQQNLLAITLGESGTTARSLLADETGHPRLVSAIRSMKMPEYIFAASIPLQQLMANTQAVHRKHLIGLGFLSFLVTGLAWLLKGLLLNPLKNLQQCLQEMTAGNYAHATAAPAIGEMGLLADLFRETVERLRQINMAKSIQENLLPKGPLKVGSFHVFGQSQMLTQVGGDYFDIIPQGPDRCLLAIGDVTGHGLSAAIVMAMVKSGLTMLSLEHLPTQEMCKILNEALLKNLSRKKMMSCIIASLDLKNGDFTFTNAGHNFPLYLPANKKGSYFRQTNLGLGSLRNRPYKFDTIPLNPGDTLILFTDGIVEAANPARKIIGYNQFLDFVKKLPPLSPENLIQAIMNSVDEHTEGAAKLDDMTVLVIQRARE